MTRLAAANDGNTPLSLEEIEGLIPNLATKEELNEWERENMLRGREWALSDRSSTVDVLSDKYVRKLHRKMFDKTWKWAGHYRLTEKNIGVSVHQIREMLFGLLGDARYWIQISTYSLDEIAIRFHHRLVFIHPFPNGNGRHARLIAGVLVSKLGRPEFTWGSANLVRQEEARRRYLETLKVADKGDVQPLLIFARS